MSEKCGVVLRIVDMKIVYFIRTWKFIESEKNVKETVKFQSKHQNSGLQSNITEFVATTNFLVYSLALTLWLVGLVFRNFI